MSQPLDPGLLNDLPAELRAGIETQLLALAAERAARRHLEVENADLRARNAELKALNARLEHLAREFQRARFGSRSEKLGEDQLALALEDIEVAVAAAQEEQDREVEARTGAKPARALRAPRSLPRQLPREERVLEPSDLRCPCGCGDMVRIGEDRSERLDVTPAQFRVVVTVRPRYACPKGRARSIAGRAPAHLIEGGLPTEATLAHVVVSKYSEHLPLYRQAQVMARHGLAIDRSTLSDWVGRTAFHLGPIVERMAELLKRSGKLFMDETPAPVLDPGRGRTRTGYLWAMLRDDRPWGGADPPGVVFAYAPGRGGSHAEDMLKGFEGVLQVDGYAGYNRLAVARRTGGAPLRLAYCWSHTRREIFKATPKSGSPVADAALARIAALYGIEKAIRGLSPDRRRAARQEQSVPLLGEFASWLRVQAERLSRKSEMGSAIAYLLKHWQGLTVFAEEGRVEMDSNLVENQIRPLALTRKNALFAGHDEGAQSWARIASLIGTCKLNGVEPYAYLKATLEAIARGHPQARLDDLLPWNFHTRDGNRQAA
jgi:transposase